MGNKLVSFNSPGDMSSQRIENLAAGVNPTDAVNMSQLGTGGGGTGPAGPAGPAGNGISGQSYDTATGILTLVFTDGGTFSTGDLRGAMGIAGTAATITVGTVTTGAPGSSVIVTNRGTATAAILDFTIPAQGAQGLQGERGPAGSGGGGGSGNAIPTTFNLPATGVDNELIRVVPPVVLDTGTRSAQSPFRESFYRVVRGNGGRLYVAIPDSLPVVTGELNPTISGSRTISIFYSDTEGESIKFTADLTIDDIDTADNIVPIVSDTQLQPTWEGSGNVALITLDSAAEATTLRSAIPTDILTQAGQIDVTNNADYFTDDNLNIYLGDVSSETFPTRGLYRWSDSNSMWNAAAFANDLPTGGGGTTSNATILNEVWRLGNAVARRTSGNIVGFNKIYDGRLATSSFVRSSTGAFQGTIYTLYDGVLTEDTSTINTNSNTNFIIWQQ